MVVLIYSWYYSVDHCLRDKRERHIIHSQQVRVGVMAKGQGTQLMSKGGWG
jgi:hypothetical protein